MQSIMGWLEFQPGESYEALRARIKSAFADKKGPGVYFANPCDQGRQSIKNLDKARFEYKESEVEMPEIPGSESNPLGDTLKTVKRAANDMAALQNLELQQKIMNKFLGTDEKDKKKEEESVDKTAAAGSNFNDILMWKTFMGDDSNKKKDAPSDALQQQLNEAKLQNSLADMRAEIKGKTKLHSPNLHGYATANELGQS